MRASIFVLMFGLIWATASSAVPRCPRAVSGSETAVSGQAPVGAISTECQLFAVGDGADVRLFRFGDGHELRRLTNSREGERFFSLEFSPDRRLLLTVSGVPSAPSHSVSLWDLAKGKLYYEVTKTAGVSARFEPGGRAILVTNGTSVERHELGRREPTARFTGHPAEVLSVAASRDGHWLLTGSRDGSARVWDLKTGRERYRYLGNGSPLVAVDFSPDASTALLAGDRARLWEPATGRIVREDGPESGGLATAALSLDGARELIATRGGRVCVLDSHSGETLWLGGLPGLVGAHFSPDGHWVLGLADGVAVRWRIE